MKRLTIGLLVLFVATALVAGNGEKPEPQTIGGLTFADEYELTIVNVIAHVNDKQGNSVTDLTKTDFEVYQDGEKKELTNFQLYTEDVYEHYAEVRSKLPPEAPTPETTIEPRAVNIIIYIDNLNLHPLDRNRVLRSAGTFVRENLRPPVQMMVVSFDKSLTILQPFTSKPGLVLDALRQVRTFSGGRPEREAARRGVLDRMKTEIENKGLGAGTSVRTTAAYADLLTYAHEETYNLAVSLDGLREVVTFLAGVEGRKSVLYISNGLAMVPGFDLFDAVSESFNDPMILSETQRFDRSPDFKSLVTAANSQDVSFYTVGAGGLEVVGMSGNEYRMSRESMTTALGAESYLGSMRYMGDKTGGLAIVKTNDFEEGFKRIQKDLYTYYSLGYRLIPSGRDKMHRTEVKVPGHPEYVIRSRPSFVEKSLQTRVQDRVLVALLQDLDENPMDLDAEIGAAAVTSNAFWMVPMSISFPINMVALLPEGEDYVGRVVLFVATRDSNGKRSDTVIQEHEIRIPSNDYELAMESRYGIGASLLMTPGSYRIAIALMDQVTRQASYKTVNTTISSP